MCDPVLFKSRAIMTTTMIIISTSPLCARIKLDGDGALGTIFLLIPSRANRPPPRAHVLFRTVSRILFPQFIILLLLRTYCTTRVCDVLLYIRLELRIILLRLARVRTHRYDEIRRISLDTTTMFHVCLNALEFRRNYYLCIVYVYTVARARSGRFYIHTPV